YRQSLLATAADSDGASGGTLVSRRFRSFAVRQQSPPAKAGRIPWRVILSSDRITAVCQQLHIRLGAAPALAPIMLMPNDARKSDPRSICGPAPGPRARARANPPAKPEAGLRLVLRSVRDAAPSRENS